MIIATLVMPAMLFVALLVVGTAVARLERCRKGRLVQAARKSRVAGS